MVKRADRDGGCLVDTGIVVDQNQSLRFAVDIARGMEFLHSMEPMVPNFLLTSKHVMVRTPTPPPCVQLLHRQAGRPDSYSL